MPNKIEKLPDGNLNVELETGEKFSGDPLTVTEKLAEAQVNTKRWGQGFKQELETLRAAPVQPPPATTQPPADANERQLQDYLLNQTARALGYGNADEYRADLMRVKATSEKMGNQIVATEFLSLNQDFPNTPEAIDALSNKIDEMKWDFSPQSMTAAHALLIREHSTDQAKGYAPLTAEQVNSAWANDMHKASRQTPPPMLNTGNPEISGGGQNDPYAMPLADLRKAAIQQELSRK